MKTLRESLFDNNLADKKLLTFGEKYDLINIGLLEGRYYTNRNLLTDDAELIGKMFKVNKLKNINPVDVEDVNFEWYGHQSHIYDPFLRILTLINGFTYIKGDKVEYDKYHQSGIDLCKDEWNKLIPYINMGKTDIRLYEKAQYEGLAGFYIIKNMGSPEKYIKLTATFEEKR